MKRALTVLAASLLWSVAAGAADAPQQVTVRGCVEAGVEPSCLVLKGGGQTYNVTAAEPKPAVGTYGTVVGTVSDGMSTCQQGIILAAAIWAVEQGKACPAP